MAENNFWTDELVKDFMVWYSGIYANPNPTDQCLDMFKKSKQQKQKDWEIVKQDYITEGSEKQIISVKRLSDNEVFSVGDKIVYGNDTISSFKIIDDAIIAYTSQSPNDYYCKLSELKKAKQSLFKTEDGKDVYEGDTVYIAMVADGSVSNFRMKESDRGFWEDAKMFSTEEAAKEYIVMNKPRLSLSDIRAVFGNDLVRYHAYEINERLRELVLNKE